MDSRQIRFRYTIVNALETNLGHLIAHSLVYNTWSKILTNDFPILILLDFRRNTYINYSKGSSSVTQGESFTEILSPKTCSLTKTGISNWQILDWRERSAFPWEHIRTRSLRFGIVRLRSWWGRNITRLLWICGVLDVSFSRCSPRRRYSQVRTRSRWIIWYEEGDLLALTGPLSFIRWFWNWRTIQDLQGARYPQRTNLAGGLQAKRLEGHISTVGCQEPLWNAAHIVSAGNRAAFATSSIRSSKTDFCKAR